jgi:ATP-dependent helicase HrpB
MSFPILDIVPTLKEKLSQHPVVILQAPPGAGKSTVLPLELRTESWLANKKMIMLEPRRLAARSVATRMASVLNEEPGKKVGYRVRFENCVSSDTKIEVVTEGILTRMIQHDNALDNVGLVIFDEFHERSLQADLALALCLQIQKILRDDLRILIMSATLDGDKLSALLDGAPIVTSLGRQYPIEHRYLAADNALPIAVRMAKAIRKAFHETTGDILAFFPGAGEIQRAAALLEEENLSVSLHPLYGDLSFKKQQEAILPHTSGLRKIVLATSIAETSLTIEGVSVVIDSGYSRVPKFDPRSGLTRLDTIKVTRDAADQRAGRAGRLGPGISYRLWNESTHHHLVAQRSPEILEADLAPMMLELSQWGTSDVNELCWITPPPIGAVSQAKELLEQLGALENGRISNRGKAMLKLPTHPRIAHMLQLSNENKNDLAIATDVAALLEERDPLARESGADLSLRLEVLRKWRSGERVNADKNVLEKIERLAQSWRKFFNIKQDNAIVADEDVGRLIAEAYPERIARQIEKNGDRYKLANGRVVRLPPHDALMREQWLSVAHLDAGVGEGKIFIAAPLNEDDLLHLAEERTTITWDEDRGMIVGATEQRVGNLILSSKPLQTISQDERIKVLCNAIRKEGLKMLGWGEQHDAWQARVMNLNAWRKDEAWPDVSDEGLLNSLEVWLSPYLINVNKRIELQRLDISSILAGILPWDLSSKLDLLAPTKIEVPSGSMISVNYFADGRLPTMEVRLQEVFGLTETPAVNEGRTKIILHLLSPGYKPVQVTQDLKSFWHNTYHEVRKELRMRYPKHSWPEDPWTAEAVRGAKKRK